MSPCNRSDIVTIEHGDFVDNSSTKFSAKVDPEDLREVHQAHPDSTQAERVRYVYDRKGDTQAAIKKLGSYLEWRKGRVDTKYDFVEHCDWDYATQLAVRHYNESHAGTLDVIDATTRLPQPFFLYHTEGGRYCQCMAARLPIGMVPDTILITAIAIYIDHGFARDSTEEASLLLDLRPGRGWANVKLVNPYALKFAKDINVTLNQLFPSRLKSCLIYPCPKPLGYLWKAVKPFIGTNTREKITLLWGSCYESSKAPASLSDHVGEDFAAEVEEKREAFQGK